MNRKWFVWMMLALSLTFTLKGRADNRVFVGEINPTKGDEIPVVLKNTESLNFFSATIQYPGTMNVQAEDIQIFPARFPWKTRGLIITVDNIEHEINVTVADLLGQNAMVLPGNGTLFSITCPGLKNLDTALEFKIKQAEAYDLKGNQVKLIW